MPKPAKPTAEANSAKYRPAFDRIIAGEPEVLIPCLPAEQAKVLGGCGYALRWLANQYATTSDPALKPYWPLCGALKFTKVDGGIRVTRKEQELTREVQSAPFAIVNPDGTTGPIQQSTIKPDSIESKVKRHEKAVIASFRGIMRTGLSMLNRVNAATTVVDMLEDEKTAPDFKDRLRDLIPDCFDVFQEVIDLDLSTFKGKEALAIEGAKLRAIRWLSEKTGENKTNLWPPKQDAEWRRRMERARQAARCTTTTPGRIFETPAVLLCFYDDDLNSGNTRLHDWQCEELAKFARALAPGEIHRQAVAAANGSGKSKNLGAPPAIWGAMEHASSVTVVTTASGKQLDKQAAKYINTIAGQVNRYHGGQLWKIQYRHLEFQPLNSDIEMFATDDEGQAEGWHPKVDGGYFAILVDEAKTVTEEIYTALTRCKGCIRRLDYSSPGGPAGHFHSVFTGGKWLSRKVTAYDCPHITPAEIQETFDTYGENSPITRSTIFAEFSALSDTLVLPLDKIQRCHRMAKEGHIPHKVELRNRAGLDLALSAGGDESVLSIWNGNKQVGQEVFRFNDLEPEVNHVIHLFEKWNLRSEDVTADADGLGKPILQRLRDRGYPVRWYRAGTPPKNPMHAKNFASQGTAAWFSFARLVEECEVILLEDKALTHQLANRYYKQAARDAKTVLEGKREARANGHGSPDRADAAIIANAFWMPEPEQKVAEEPKGKTIEDIERMMDDDVFRAPPEPVPGAFPTLAEVCS